MSFPMMREQLEAIRVQRTKKQVTLKLPGIEDAVKLKLQDNIVMDILKSGRYHLMTPVNNFKFSFEIVENSIPAFEQIAKQWGFDVEVSA